MGKRKERRLAAKMAANRRVKLDLVAEPSGDMVASSAHDEVGGDIDQDHHAVVPTSPSSSGQRQENPLLLLGQYSDDELDEETSKRPKIDADESSSDDLDVEEPAENLGDTEKDINGDNQQPDQVDTVENLDCMGADGKESDPTCAAAEDDKAGPAKQANVPESSGTQVDGDLAGGWKLVMHEESNQYYYWNTVTGETSWEVPTALAEQTVSSVGGDASDLDARLATESANYAYESAVGALGGSHLISKDAGECHIVLEIKTENGDVAHMDYNANQALAHYNDPTACVSYVDPSALSDYGSLQTSAANAGQLTVPMAEDHVSKDEVMDKHLRETNECYGTADGHSCRLVKFCESLLHRMEALDRSGGRLEGHEWITKEIEIRLSDCNALSSYGASLLPFWWHIEAHLKQLESAVSKREASLVVHGKHDGNLEATQNSFLGDKCLVPSAEPGSETENEKGMPSTMKSRCHSPILDASKLQTEATSYVPDSKDVETEGLPSASQQLGSEQEQESFQDSNPNTASVNLAREVEPCADEDIDMDVEMEVDEEPPSGQTASECPFQSEQLVQLNQSPLEFPQLPSDELIPPPPDEEWIPPPPPDSEPVPPPPPEEPPLPSVPPPYPETMLCPPYPDQYGVGYTAPAYAYYPATAEVVDGNYYAQAEGSHISEPHPPSYYEPVVTSAVHAVTVDVAPVEPVAYYDISSGTVPSGPVVSSIGSSVYYIESGPFSYHGSVPTSDYTGSVGFTMETGNNIALLPKVNPVPAPPATVTESQASVLQAAFVASSTPSVGSASGNGSIVDAVPAGLSKNQTKVVRRKKHTIAGAPSLRSNKKVSSLVDKWKAAKEELHSEEDEEPEDAYEVLEKKRKKEIEEWRARQIASGEAQENANFLPLGGDWRERVKRKKAAAKTEAIQTPTEAVDSEKQQPDLVELSKDLPPGWQAYWDESSKEIYYGNSITSETTWTRPTR